MKNIHLLPTEKPSRLYLFEERLILGDLVTVVFKNSGAVNQNIFITSDEEIKEGVDQWYLDKFLNKPMNSGGAQYGEKQNVIILTTDQDLIKDGVQAIDDEFLEWFVKNPTCEYVEVSYELGYCLNCEWNHDMCPNAEECLKNKYTIIIPKEEPKQETLEEAAENYLNMFNGAPTEIELFIAGAKWQEQRMYSEEEVITAFYNGWISKNKHTDYTKAKKEWFEQFKKK